jgi:hypothetical protein
MPRKPERKVKFFSRGLKDKNRRVLSHLHSIKGRHHLKKIFYDALFQVFTKMFL